MGTAANGCGQANFWFYFLGMRLQRGLKNTPRRNKKFCADRFPHQSSEH